MSVVKWAKAVSGDWNTAADWSPAGVPIATSSVRIGVAPPAGKTYTVTITTPVSIASLTLDANGAELLSESTLKAKTIAIQAGTLDIGPSAAGSATSLSGNATLSGGTLALNQGSSFHGTLTQTGGTLVADNGTLFGTVIADGGTSAIFTADSNSAEAILNNVTWEGALNLSSGTLAIVGGATFTGAGGTGPGQVTANAMLLKNVSSLNNATITLSSLNPRDDLLVKTPYLTFGSALTVLNPGINAGSSPTTITNNGTLIGNDYGGTGIDGGNGQNATNATFVNNGLVEDNFNDTAGSSVNNGVIEVFSTFSLATFATTGTLTNAGSILVANTGLLDAANLTNTGQIAAAGGGLKFEGTLNNTGLITLSAGADIVPLNAIENSGTIAFTSGTLQLDTAGTANISGTGVIELGTSASTQGSQITVNLSGAVSAGQTLAFIAGYDTLGFGSIADAQLFAGTITGLDGSAVFDPSFTFYNATITAATIAGSAIDITFSNSATATLATGAPLGGTLSFQESGSNAILLYTPSHG